MGALIKIARKKTIFFETDLGGRAELYDQDSCADMKTKISAQLKMRFTRFVSWLIRI